METLGIYHMRCLRCKHLVEGATKNFKKCHYDQGNEDCPAREVRIAPVGKVTALVKRLFDAEASSDVAKTAKIWDEIGKEPASTRARFMNLVNAARAAMPKDRGGF